MTDDTTRLTVHHRDFVSPLFVPGDRPDRVIKAIERGARTVIIDLEDAIPAARKAAARALATQALGSKLAGITYLVRVNAATDIELMTADVAAVVNLCDGLILPKAESPANLRILNQAVHSNLDLRRDAPFIIPIIESALGVRNAWDIASADGVETLLFGNVDLSAQLGIALSTDRQPLLFARSQVVLACAAAGRRKPVDGPELTIDDATAISEAAEASRSLGFGGKIAIHPNQLGPIAEAFRPSASEIHWAETILAAFASSLEEGRGVVKTEDGTFIDAPVAARAQAIIDSVA